MNRLIIFLLAMVPLCVKAQWGFDFVSVEAYINDHKTQRSLLLARSTLEMSNNVLHENSSKECKRHRDIGDELDKYTRAFDAIDALYQSLRTALNIKTTYNTVSTRIGDYKTMLDAYREKCLAHGDIVSTDTLIISINRRAVERITKEAEGLYRSVSDLVLYATGAANCSTAELIAVLDRINIGLDRIRLQLNTAYFDTWRYIQVRIGYWKRSVYRARTLREITTTSLHRWLTPGAK